MLGVNAVNALNGFSRFRGRGDVVHNMNAPNHKNAVFRLDLTCDFSRQMFIACVDLARLQRASEGAGESTTRSSHDVVKGGRVGLDSLRLDAVVFSNRTVFWPLSERKVTFSSVRCCSLRLRSGWVS